MMSPSVIRNISLPVIAALAALAQPNLSFAQSTCAATRLIHEIQGNSASQLSGGVHDDVSPLNGQTVTVEGIVVADFQQTPQPTRSGELRGFFVQEELADQDADPATSEGMFVFTGNNPPADVQEGQRVCITGPVSEFFGMTQVSATGAGSVVVTTSSAAVPTAAELTFPVVGDINDYYEQFEGMRVHFAEPLHVSEYFEVARYGQIVLTAGGRPYQYTHEDTTPSAAEYAEFLDQLRRRRIILDDDNNTQNAPLPAGEFFHPRPNGFGVGLQGQDYFRGGDLVENLTGVLHWSFAGQSGTDAWRIRPTLATPPTFSVANPRPTELPTLQGHVRVGSFNVLNYFNTIDTTSSSSSGPCGPSGTLDCRGADSAAEFDRQNTKLIAALAEIDADVLGLVEIENNGDEAVSAVRELVTRLNGALGASTYDYISTGAVGTDAITVALIYKTSVVEPQGTAAILDDPAFTDPNSTGQQRNRPAIAQTFRVVESGNPDLGAAFTVVVNHLKSKGADGAAGADVDQLDGQSAWNDTRTRAAEYLANAWIPSDPTGQGDSDYLIIGDLNAYRGEDPISALRDAGYVDLHELAEGPDAYSYLFDGQLGYLDHALANASMASQIADLATWHINADEVPVFDYNDTVRDTGEQSFEAEPTGNDLYEPNAARTSDHDPIVIGLDLDVSVTRGDVDGDGDIDQIDIDLIVAARNQPASGPTDPRDVDGNGTINVQDARLATLACTRLRCAS